MKKFITLDYTIILGVDSKELEEYVNEKYEGWNGKWKVSEAKDEVAIKFAEEYIAEQKEKGALNG